MFRTAVISAFLALTVSTSCEAFVPAATTSSSLSRKDNVAPTQQLRMSYLDSLTGAAPISFNVNGGGSGNNNPTTFGQLLSNDDINDPCVFNAASLDLQNSIATHGGVTAAQIQDSIRKANEVVSIIRHHFPGALGSSEILIRVKNVLDAYGAENILLTQSVCPDEINHEHGDITNLLIEEIGGGKVFHLGGLAGVP